MAVKGGIALWICGVALLLAAALMVGLTQLSPFVRTRAVEALHQRFASQVELATLEVTPFPMPTVKGGGLTFRHRGRTDVPPLIVISGFAGSAGFTGLVGRPTHIRRVELTGLTLNIPAGGLKAATSDLALSVKGEPEEGEAGAGTAAETRPDGKVRTLLIDELESKAATLEIASKDPTKLPRRFDIHNLRMWNLGDGRGASFRATLTNPKPEGRIATLGVIGPWDADEPRATPVKGTYTFENANLDTIKGIGGILSSNGRYTGALERIAVTGETDTPDFSIDVARQPVHLRTTFEAIVDGTNGNTWLERVDGMLARTAIHARGSIVRSLDVKGRHIALDVAITDGRLEDVLALAVSANKPPMSGRITVTSKVVIPAGEADVVDKLRLNGSFSLAQARFADIDVQKRINMLSQRGKGNADGDGPSVVSRLRGTFVMDHASIRFSRLSFDVPGATIALVGNYNLRSEAIDFTGDLLLEAGLSKTTTGWKSMVAFVAQPFFRRPGGGSKVPIRISGTRTHPTFGLDIKKALLPG